MDNIIGQSKFSHLLINIFPDGTVEYDGKIGPLEDFPLTEAELAEVDSALATLVS